MLFRCISRISFSSVVVYLFTYIHSTQARLHRSLTPGRRSRLLHLLQSAALQNSSNLSNPSSLFFSNIIVISTIIITIIIIHLLLFFHCFAFLFCNASIDNFISLLSFYFVTVSYNALHFHSPIDPPR